MAREPDKRITELEMQLAHTQHLLDQLNQVVTQQATKIDRLSNVIERLNRQIDDLKVSDDDKRDLLDEKPPHY
jgi:SlyX protein